MMPNGKRDQAESGIGDAGHAGVGDQRDLGAAFEIDDQFGGFGHLVVLVIADQSRLDAVMAEQLQGLARVLAGDQVDFFEDAQGAQRDVFEIADGRGDEVERWACQMASASCVRLSSLFESSKKALTTETQRRTE